MQHICPLERNSFPHDDTVGATKEILKHLKKCPLYLKALYLHYNPFYFPNINDTSSYLIDKGDIEEELRKYHVAFNETILQVLKKKIRITTFDQFRTLKYKIILEHFLNHGVEHLLSKLGDEDFVRKLQEEVQGELPGGVATSVQTAVASGPVPAVAVKEEGNGEEPTRQPMVEPPLEDSPEGDPLLSIANQFLDGHISAVKKLIYHLRETPHRKNGKNSFVKEQLGRLSSVGITTEAEGENICGVDGVDTNGRNSNSTKKHPLPILTLQRIGDIHKYRLCQDLLQFIDEEVFPVKQKKNEEENIEKEDTITDEQLIEKENLGRDEIISIIIYTVIYLCCKMSIIKRLKNKNFHYKNYLNSSGEKSIYFFLENLDKHDLQNVNMIFLLLHFNNDLFGIFKCMFDERACNRSKFISLRDYLFIELGAGKANTTRWVKFIMDDLVDILEKFFSRRAQRGEGNLAEKVSLTGEKVGTQTEEQIRNPIGQSPEPPQQRARCKLLIIERESLRNKKEKKNFLMQMTQEKNEHLLRIKADISDFHLSKFIYFSENGFKGEGDHLVFIPDIIQFYYYKGVYNWRGSIHITDNLRGNLLDGEGGRGVFPPEGEQVDDPLKTDEQPNDGRALITETFLRNNLMQLGTYFDVHVKKLLSFLTQGNNNLLKVYDDMNNFLENFHCKKVTFITKHLCGNGTDLALRMLVNNTKNKDKENYFILAPCCHHRCDVYKILGFEVLKKLGVNEGHLQHFVRHMSGYASCDNQEKKTIGKKVKLLVDLVRILYLLDEGLENVYLIKYVNRSITIENHVIVFFNHHKLDLRNFKHF
ncbi:conserved Plasmodium protein, unknown function [Plasmodium knowlesi strain H]|uniref:tRNA:m(4)X modification enzyme TRM13 n=3 Tax=Plasmodium knowlesi TaxID=5850 RepID=A0A5K1U4K1_PLAKH|nr:methyltransferase, putative [Plasmodium knowlesi strain H]OTN65137.1 Uncharacterized protein PKNOH_S120147400 [Plasmodium knowlesi]CAA9988331.1 methyltransferase, putative [Plasmodium knowlesi strain H]SBO20144.1 conserved Plasmodium protein, unknown function [Plasmodium knowlesi strain H]SBO20283.1 conserved Plasmodium protein, unknown function [Plasmodium knowlesi strain H]VVS77805.1 methyltransferase, putative [Plasmodium knowlesi strain H]|eukprot:XP_002259310.1 hypothetical protein, conserved in Plasmodium species [Plasmodium knowlesi strain H]